MIRIWNKETSMKTIREIVGSREAYAVEPDMTIRAAVKYLCDRKIGAVAVCDEQRHVVGVFSERDLLRRVINKDLDPEQTLIRDVMSEGVVHVGIDEPHYVARNLMLGQNFRHLVVLDVDESFKGFVSIRELIEVDLKESKELIHKLNDDYYEEQFKPDPR